VLDNSFLLLILTTARIRHMQARLNLYGCGDMMLCATLIDLFSHIIIVSYQSNLPYSLIWFKLFPCIIRKKISVCLKSTGWHVLTWVPFFQIFLSLIHVWGNFHDETLICRCIILYLLFFYWIDISQGSRSVIHNHAK
jgi:hypothetical protein